MCLLVNLFQVRHRAFCRDYQANKKRKIYTYLLLQLKVLALKSYLDECAFSFLFHLCNTVITYTVK